MVPKISEFDRFNYHYELSGITIWVYFLSFLLRRRVGETRLENSSSISLLSRELSAESIRREKVFLNHLEVNSASKQIKDGDIISVRGQGRIKIESIDGETRKGRMKISVLRYWRVKRFTSDTECTPKGWTECVCRKMLRDWDMQFLLQRFFCCISNKKGARTGG